MSDPGRFVWYELLTSDPAAAQAFYADVVGWRPEATTAGGAPYTMFVGPQGPIGLRIAGHRHPRSRIRLPQRRRRDPRHRRR